MPGPGARQRAAADPAASVWVSASAGSGKTKVLTDRVLSLLLEGTPPQHILCLTFTRAAAAEMANRVNGTLSSWATVDDGSLRAALEALTGIAPDALRMTQARRLFARVLDVPGGLKVQTIHSFCESLLGRFPIEAGLAPHFEVIDERSAAEMIAAAHNNVLVRSARDPALRRALDAVTRHVDEPRFAELMAALSNQRHRLGRFLLEAGGLEGATAAIRARLGLDDGDTEATIVAAAVRDGAFDRAALTRAAQALLRGSEKSDRPRGQAIADWLAADAPARAGGLDDYAAAFLTAQDELRAESRIATKAVREALPGIVDTLYAEGNRLIEVRDRLRALATAEATAALVELGSALLEAYAAAKRSVARLDYDDLILLTGQLLNRQGIAPWVLFKLDGGIDHILIDEAQDTSPQQWEVVARLAEEFFTGEGARDLPRTIFAVGDVKQSIFSFQHADPEEFRRMRDYFARRVTDSGGNWRPVELDTSFRSTEAVLGAVDLVFARGAAARGVVEPGTTLRHFAHRTGHAGLVELWPPVAPRAREDEEVWSAPVERRAGDDPKGRLARLLAHRISSWIGSESLESRGRKVRAGDIMVLVRTRTGFFEELVRSLKDLRVPVSGVDRMVLTDQIAVMDLVALGRFLLLPEDDLTLATVLKGPMIGFGDDELFELAWDRGGQTVWQRLNAMAGTGARYQEARDWLADLLAAVDFTPPYELYARVLAGPAPAGGNGRQCMLARLGLDADDPIDELLNLAFSYERGHAASLEGFLHWAEAGEVTVKRDLEQAGRDEVRVMTVHGAKGLQAPIVVLPDTMSKPRSGEAILWDGDLPLWPPGAAYRDKTCEALLQAAGDRADEEYRRLLYVAMTRAEDRLYVCGVQGRNAPPDDCWYDLVRHGLDGVAEDVAFDFCRPAGEGLKGTGLRLANPQQAEPKSDREATAVQAGPIPPRGWMLQPAAREVPPPKPLAPSRDTDAEPPVVSPAGADNSRRFHRGIIIHTLLEVLPDLPAAQRRAAAEQYLARPAHGLDAAAQARIAAEVMAVLEDAAFGAIFGPGSRAEVAVTGRVEYPDGPVDISGQIDRLLITGAHAMIVDFKSNRPPPETMADVAEIYWRQMGEYRDIIAQLYPGRPVRCALLWTDGPRLMELTGSRLDRGQARP
jgi:ATP-dependent helicase/nuclease subunit A